MTKRLSETTAQMDRAIGSRIRGMRILRGLSQSELGSPLGVTFQQIQKYEKGTNRVAASTLVIISETLQVSPLEILGVEASSFDSSAFADLAQRCRDLESRIARAKRALGERDDASNVSVNAGIEFNDDGKMQAYARTSPPN